MKKLLSILVAIFFVVACKSSQPYNNPQVKSLIPQHKKVAILPFKVSFSDDYKEVIRGGKSTWNEQERIAGLDLQKAGYEYLAKRAYKKKYDLVVQDFLSTNRTLEQANIPFSELMVMDKSRLANLLGVDAVIFGYCNVDFNVRLGYTGNNGIRTSLELYDGSTDQKIWSLEDKEYIRSRMDSPQDLSRRSLGQLIDALPYKASY